METIRNYLESMFSKLPNTPEVRKAKHELGQMMEDKYSQLISEGKTDNEAVAIVISEFGNLDELAEDLGIKNYMNTTNEFTGRTLSLEEAKSYISCNHAYALKIALGVMLCILSPIGVIVGSASYDFDNSLLFTKEKLGIVCLFVAVAIAVGLFIYSGISMEKWNFLKQQPCNIDFTTAQYVESQKENNKAFHSLFLIIGIMFCILCAIPAIILDGNMMLEDISAAFVLVFVAIGVFMIVLTSIRTSGYNTLLKLNNSSTMGGNFVPSQQNDVKYNSKTAAAVMSVFWPTITCIYLSWSFLSADWHITWIIWPIAGIAETFIKNMWGNKK